MAPIPREIGLTDEELDRIMSTTANMRVATIGPGNRINLTPLWFGWAGGRIYFHARGQKIANLRRNPETTVLVDLNERFPELIGAMFQGKATILEDAAAEDADPHLEEARLQMGNKYQGQSGDPDNPSRSSQTASGSSRRWVVLEPERMVTWDNHKLSSLRH